MSVAYVSPYSDPPAFRAQSSPASQIGQKLSGLWADVTVHARSNASDWRPLTNALIEAIWRECQSPGWDGYGARAVHTSAKTQAQRFVDLLPYRLPAPDPTADPDGDVSLLWDFGPGHVFSVSVSADGTLTYAGLLGGGVKRHGVEPFSGEIPKIILQSIDELCERSRASSRNRAG
jgi:hypothetical protein